MATPYAFRNFLQYIPFLPNVLFPIMKEVGNEQHQVIESVGVFLSAEREISYTIYVTLINVLYACDFV